MSGTTITNAVTVTTGISLPGDYTLTNTATGVITNDGVAVLGAPSSTPDTVVNAGSIGGTTAGVSLRSGGVVTNQAAGVVTGATGIAVAVYSGSILNQGQVSASGDAIVIAPGGTVSNAASGSVIAGGLGIVIGAQPGVAENAGSVAAARTGIVLYGGGTAANLSGGTIVAGVDGIYVAGDTATNQGLITATRHGMFLNGGGTVTNMTGGVISASQQGIVISGGTAAVTNAAGASITGRYDAVRLYGGVETVTNAGTLAGTYGWGVQLQSAGTVSNAAGAVASGGYGGVRLSAGGTVINAGTLIPLGTASGDGVRFSAGGVLSNAATGVVQGRSRGANLYGAAATVLNDGLIDASLGAGILLSAGGSVTNAAGATLSGAAFGLYLTGVPATVANAGIVTGTTNSGIGGTIASVITNAAGGTITGHYSGIGFSDGTPTIVNAGRVQGLAGSAIQGSKGGTVTNLAGGDLSSLDYGVALGGDTATVDNAGIIAGTNNRGVYLVAGGAVTNAASGTINGYGGVAIVGASGTVVNAGSIGASGNYAVRFGAGFTNRLVIAPGAVFTGKVQGANTAGAPAVSTLELGAGTGAIASLGTQFINFGQTVIDAGGAWTLMGTNTIAAGGTIANAGTLTLLNAALLGAADLINDGMVLIDPSTVQLDDLSGTGTVTIDTDSTLAVGGTVAATETITFATTSGTLSLGTPAAMAGLITGFDAGTVIDLPDAMVAQSGTILAGNTLQVVIAGGPVLDFRLDPAHDYQFQSVVVSADQITLSPPCFRAGTLIRTTRGPVAVQDLCVGDCIVTASGEPGQQAVAWIGRREVDCARHPRPDAVWPIRIEAGAFAKGIPARDLWLSPNHAVFADNVLIPVKYLVNGTTVVREPMDRVVYFHVELPRHDVLLAEELPCETYLDTGDRANFDNGGDVVHLHPDFAMRVWDAMGCAPLHVAGPALESVRARLSSRIGRTSAIGRRPAGGLRRG